jgi:acyl-CoA reductase-like NAD-dependent aldehyde dehydrogenase
LSASILAEVMQPGVVNIVNGTGKETGDALVRHPRVKRIAFIGSVQTGMAIPSKSCSPISRKTLSFS